jgi:phosphoribosylaminoimidazolecarboxamide formyltransferase/IMP cyclohydrolase
MKKIERALISVSDKTGIVDFAKGLESLGVEILSTGGTRKKLDAAGIKVVGVSDYTGFAEMMDGRVKTLHPKIHAGLLALRDDKKHVKQMEERGFGYIDVVVVNLYPFRETIAKPNVTLEEAVEQIDIGGPTMLRSAAKNFRDVAVIVNPERYGQVLEEIRDSGVVSDDTLYALAQEVFEHTAAYDAAISAYLHRQGAAASTFPQRLTWPLEKVQDLRYGENPHQEAAFYREPDAKEPSVSTAEKLWGKDLSYNNIMDIDAAIEIVKEFEQPAAVVIKHTNPCGGGIGASLAEAYGRAKEGDPVSAFGSIIGLNRPVDAATAKLIASPNTFIEAVIAPDFDEKALDILKTGQKWGQNVRILRTGALGAVSDEGFYVKRVVGGLLIQDFDGMICDAAALKVVTQREPTEKEKEDLMFAWVICKHVKSNAIVYAKNGTVVGVGAGQMSRVDSSMIGARKAGDRAKGSVLASDAFFPFRDGVDAAAEAGVTAIIEPGGSVKDDEVIKAADEHGMAMLFTGMRHFRH